METEYPYQVYSPLGQLVLEATLDCRYPADIELRMLDVGFTIQIHGKRLTKPEVRKEADQVERKRRTRR